MPSMTDNPQTMAELVDLARTALVDAKSAWEQAPEATRSEDVAGALADALTVIVGVLAEMAVQANRIQNLTARLDTIDGFLATGSWV